MHFSRILHGICCTVIQAYAVIADVSLAFHTRIGMLASVATLYDSTLFSKIRAPVFRTKIASPILEESINQMIYELFSIVKLQ